MMRAGQGVGQFDCKNLKPWPLGLAAWLTPHAFYFAKKVDFRYSSMV